MSDWRSKWDAMPDYANEDDKRYMFFWGVIFIFIGTVLALLLAVFNRELVSYFLPVILMGFGFYLLQIPMPSELNMGVALFWLSAIAVLVFAITIVSMIAAS